MHAIFEDAFDNQRLQWPDTIYNSNANSFSGLCFTDPQSDGEISTMTAMQVNNAELEADGRDMFFSIVTDWSQ